jgi:trigger factor
MNYASTIEEISATRRKFKISVPKGEVTEAFKAAIAEIQSTAEVRGFRKGKVPVTIVRKFFENDVRKRAVQKLVDNSYGEAIKTTDLQIVSQPHIEPVSTLSEHEEFKYDAIVDINPPIEIQGYKELTLKGPNQQVTDADVDSALQNLGRALGKFNKVTTDRPVGDKDLVKIDLEISVDGKMSKDLSKSDLRIDLSRPETMTEFRSNLVGASLGQSKSFQVSYPANYPEERLAGKTADLTVKVTSIEEIEIPAFDDAFAKRFGTESMEVLRRSLLESLTKNAETKRLEVFGEQIVDQVLSKNTFEVPESLVESTIDRQIAEANMRLDKASKLSSESPEIRGRFRDEATKNVQAILALGNIARVEGITVSEDEVGPELFSIAQSMGISIKELVNQGGRMVIDEARGRVLINKTIKHLVGLSKIELA